MIEHANGNISRIHRVELRQKGYTEDDDILSPVIMEIAETLVSHDERSISQKDLAQLSFWTEYGLNAVPFVRHLVREHILHDSIFDGRETLYFAFDQMNDYYKETSVKSQKIMTFNLKWEKNAWRRTSNRMLEIAEKTKDSKRTIKCLLCYSEFEYNTHKTNLHKGIS